MSKIVFFSIPAYGHTNPTIEVVRQLTLKGNEVWYYSFDEFKEKIENAGARYIRCDDYLPELKKCDEGRVGKDFSALIEMAADTTLAMDKKVLSELEEFKPDCIVADSMCLWGKLFAQKLGVSYICSTTTFAFNGHTAKMMKQGIREIITMILGMNKVNKKLQLLRESGYYIKDMISLISNDNETNTIVYTSKEFQPMTNTFSDKYSFIGPSVPEIKVQHEERQNPKIYISLGTVNNKNINFYKNCIRAFENSDVNVIMSVGKKTNISELGHIPDNFEVRNSVNQIEVLQNTDVFLSHGGMNSANESLYYGVPMVLYPSQSEQAMVAGRIAELGAGVLLKSSSPKSINDMVLNVICNDKYRNNALRLSDSFKKCGGAKEGAEVIMKLCSCK